MKKKFRVTKNEEFTRIIHKRKYYSCPVLTIYIQPRVQFYARVGISVPKKLTHAVGRNKIRRQIRMMVQDIYNFEEIFDTIILVRAGFLNESYINNKKSLECLVKKVRI